MPPALFFLKIALAIWGLLFFHTYFRIIGLIFVKNAIFSRDCIEYVDFFLYMEIYIFNAIPTKNGIFSRDCIEYVDFFLYMEILTVLILPIHECDLSLFLWSSSNFSQFHVVFRLVTSLVKFIPLYFILFDGVVNRIFLIFQY